MATYKLSYFDVKGTGEIVRLVFGAAGKNFEDQRLSGEQWPAFKLETPMGQMPVLTVTKGGKKSLFCQSGTIARSLAREFGLAGQGSEEQMLIEEVYDSVGDVLTAANKFYYEKDEGRKAAAKTDFIENHGPRLGNYVAKRMKEYGKNGFIIGSKLSLADLALFNIFDQSSGMGFADVWAKFPDVAAHAKKVQGEKNVAAYLAKRPK